MAWCRNSTSFTKQSTFYPTSRIRTFCSNSILCQCCYDYSRISQDDVIKGNHFPLYWPFVRGIHLSPVRRSFDVFLDLSLNKRLSKQSWGWWLETPSRSLWHHCNDGTRFMNQSTFYPTSRRRTTFCSNSILCQCWYLYFRIAYTQLYSFTLVLLITI